MQRSPCRLKTVLVVDDDPDIVDFLYDLLELEGYRAKASVKAESLEKLEDEDLPDLILLDVFLSGRDGRELLRYLKQREETTNIPVIMFSAHSSVEASVRAAGAADFLAKPFDIDELLAKVKAYLL